MNAEICEQLVEAVGNRGMAVVSRPHQISQPLHRKAFHDEVNGRLEGSVVVRSANLTFTVGSFEESVEVLGELQHTPALKESPYILSKE
jgi:hypothetical protein